MSLAGTAEITAEINLQWSLQSQLTADKRSNFLRVRKRRDEVVRKELEHIRDTAGAIYVLRAASKLYLE